MKKVFDLEMVLTHLAEGNDTAIEELYNAYYSRLYNFSKKFLKLDEGIDDILQEVFLKIWQNRKQIKCIETFNAFIFTITRNLLLNELRTRLNDHKMKERIGKLAVSVEYSFIEQLEYHDLKEKVEMAIDDLPSRQKEVFTLSRIHGYSHKEIAQTLNITTKTVEFHLAKSVVLLRKRLMNFELTTPPKLHTIH